MGFAGSAAADPSRELDAEVEEIEVVHRHGRTASTESWSEVPLERIRRTDARSVADVLRRAPGVSARVNSRGQTLVFMRNGGERQVVVFFDGAPLDVPWDRRVDLGFLPVTGLGRVEVARGALSNQYGPHTAGGAIFLETGEPSSPAALTLSAEGGSAGRTRFDSFAGISPRPGTSLSVAAVRSERAGEPLAEPLLFSQPDRSLRTNTAARRSSALLRATLRAEGSELALSALHASGAINVAPEAHLNPATEGVRYWRYPRLEMSMLTARMKLERGPFEARVLAWGQSFRQALTSYRSVRYEQVDERQEDRDQSLGARARLLARLGSHDVSLTAFGRLSSHDELRFATASGASARVEERFVHGDWSLGANYAGAFGDLLVRAGVGFEGLEPFETAGRSSPGGIRGGNLTLGARYDLNAFLSLRTALGSRVRLPTPRELFGTALDRFVLNEGLGPERIHSLEFGLIYRRSIFRLELIPFAGLTEGTLDQENIIVDGATLRRRVNLDGAWTAGAEFIAEMRPSPWLRVAGQLLWSEVRRRSGPETRLTERPRLQGYGELVLGERQGLELAGEVMARSDAYSLAPDGLRSVPGGALLHGRVAYRAWHADLGQIEVYLRVDNVFDRSLEPQLGLPEPGRWIRSGVVFRR